MTFDHSGLRWLGISDLIAEPEGPTFISSKVTRSRLDRLRFVTQGPLRRTASPPHTDAFDPIAKSFGARSPIGSYHTMDRP